MPSLLDRHLRIPKYLQLADTLREQIMSGALRPGDRLPSFVDMRREYGATQNTVEKVLALLERDGLIVREPSRGTFVTETNQPIIPSRRYPSSRTGIIGVSGLGFQFDTYAAYWAELLSGMRQGADAASVQVLLLDHTSTKGWEKADGVLVCDWSAHDILDKVPSSQPCVSVLVDLPGMASVTADDYQGGRIATEYLLELGHRNIAYLHGMDVSIMPVRLSGYRDALADAGIIPDGRWTAHLTGFYRDNSEFEERAFEAMERWFRKDWHKHNFSALLCHNDAAALGAIKALEANGLRVPHDVSVIGFDAAETTPLLPGGLTSVEVPLQAIGRKSAEVLMRQIEADSAYEERYALPTRIRIGATTVQK